MVVASSGFDAQDGQGNIMHRASRAKFKAALGQGLIVCSMACALLSGAAAAMGPTMTLKKIAVEDCRVLQAFVGAPVDGCPNSLRGGGPGEYPNRAGAGVRYSCHNNGGLHITLADAPFNLVVLRGGARTAMYANASEIGAPGDGRLLHAFPGGAPVQTVAFDKPVDARKISFFETQDGEISEVSFYSADPAGQIPGKPVAWFSDSTGAADPPQELVNALRQWHGEKDLPAILPPPAPGSLAGPLSLNKDRPVFLLSSPVAAETGVSGVTFRGNLAAKKFPATLTVVVYDPIDPRRDLAAVPVRVERPCAASLAIDVQDQVVPKDGRLLLSLQSDQDAQLAPAQGEVLSFHAIKREQALPQSLAWRKLILKSEFGALSEPRPWGGFHSGQTRQQFFAGVNRKYVPQLRSLFAAIDQCHGLAPDDALVRQYREWVYGRHLKQFLPVQPPPPAPKGVPSWAWTMRAAWLEARRVVSWWVDERMVATGEFGGVLGDDTDLYQRFADIPMFEAEGPVPALKEGAVRLAELAQIQNLRQGINIRTADGLHAYEEGINHLALMTRWFFGDPVHFERSMESARNIEKLTILTDDGRRHFRDGNQMSAADLDTPRTPDVECRSTPLMWHTALAVADYNGNPHLLRLVTEWVETWLRFGPANRSWPTAVEVATGKVKESRPDSPFRIGEVLPGTINFYLYELVRNKRHIEPFLAYYRMGDVPEKPAWVLDDAYILGGLDDFDRAALENLEKFHPAAAALIREDPQPLVDATLGSPDPKTTGGSIRTLHDAQRFPDMYTTSHQNTDRIDLGLLPHASASYLGGYTSRNKFNPTHAVSWSGLGTDYAAFVLRNRRDGLKVAVYNFSQEPAVGTMTVWRLDRGQYDVATGVDRDGDFQPEENIASRSVELARACRTEIRLAPRTTTIVTVKQTRALDSMRARADLALSAREVYRRGRTVQGVVHNIGAQAAAEVALAVVDPAGRVLARADLGALDAPVDLLPKTKPFTLQLPDEAPQGCRLLLDPDNRVPEIYEGNNDVPLDILPAPDYAALIKSLIGRNVKTEGDGQRSQAPLGWRQRRSDDGSGEPGRQSPVANLLDKHTSRKQ